MGLSAPTGVWLLEASPGEALGGPGRGLMPVASAVGLEEVKRQAPWCALLAPDSGVAYPVSQVGRVVKPQSRMAEPGALSGGGKYQC